MATISFINGFRFLREINSFNLANYQTAITWTSTDGKPYKVYTKELSVYFYLHDEAMNTLYEVEPDLNVDIYRNTDKLLTSYKIMLRSKK